jgi:hypothetical protein
VISQAVILTARGASPEDVKVAKLLRFFGIQSQTLTIEDFLAQDGAGDESFSKCRLICSSEVFLRLKEESNRNRGRMPRWEERIHSAFVYSGDDSESLQILVGGLIGDNGATIHQADSGAGDLAVSDDLKDFCGVMTGVRTTASKANGEANRVLSFSKGTAMHIISAPSGASFLKVDYQHVPVFLSTSRGVIDIDTQLGPRNFDVREHFLSAVPIVLYIKWAFAETCWNAPETNACLIIDDPLLKPSYGCINFEELLALMERRHFTTNIAFIPWNWRRSSREVVRLFAENPDRFSLSVHGCNHTRAEYGSADRERLYWKTQQALERMNHHESDTGLRYDRVMVFPQGVFSEAAMEALKHTNIIAAVNNDVISADADLRVITISDVWDVAVMRYSNFPLFTRRDPSDGIENFAFDILLGKPCLVVIHHDYCQNGYRHLLELIDHLNALHCPLSWRNLGEVVKRSYRRRELSADVVEIEAYGSEVRIENHAHKTKRFVITRPESNPSLIEQVRVGSVLIPWRSSDGRIRFEVELKPREIATVRVHFRALTAEAKSYETIPHRIRTMLRRYASELRDNYIMTNKLILGTRMRSVVSGDSGSRTPEPMISAGRHRSRTPSGRSNS